MSTVSNKSNAVFLPRELFLIKTGKNTPPLYGGDQSLFESRSISKSGCGLIAGANVLCHLTNTQPSFEEYTDICLELNKKYIPISRRFGIDGIRLACGLRRALKSRGMSFRVRWCASASAEKTQQRICGMLKENIPVILSAGPPLPFFGKSAVTLFAERGGKLVPAARIRSHYVTVTSDNGKFFAVSSWGKKYFILKEEFFHYSSRRSISLFSNIVYISKIAEK